MTSCSPRTARPFAHRGRYGLALPIFNSKADRSVWSDSDVLCFIQGQIDKDVLSYSKSNTIQVRSALGA